MKLSKGLMTAVATAALSLSAMTANALPLSGTFTIDIYRYNAGGSSAAAAATAANVTANAGNLVNSITYTGALNFETPPGNTIFDFLNSGGGTLSDTTGLNVIMTAGGFTTTTLFDIKNNSLGAGSGVINHDDGISLFDDGVLVTPASAANPTVEIPTPYSFNGGAFRLIYSAANGNPEVLNVEFTPVPLPAAAWLLFSGLAGLGVLGRRRKTA